MNMHELFWDSDDTEDVEEGHVVFRQGDPPDLMYVVLAGEVEITVDDEVIDRLREGDVFGEMALVDDFARSATARATRPSRLARLDRDGFVDLVREEPSFALEVLSIVADRFRRHMAVTKALQMRAGSEPASR